MHRLLIVAWNTTDDGQGVGHLGRLADGPHHEKLTQALDSDFGRDGQWRIARDHTLAVPLAHQSPEGIHHCSISRLRRATKASSAPAIAGSNGGGTASASNRFQSVFARSVAVFAPSACHVSKLRQSDTSGE